MQKHDVYLDVYLCTRNHRDHGEVNLVLPPDPAADLNIDAIDATTASAELRRKAKLSLERSAQRQVAAYRSTTERFNDRAQCQWSIPACWR